MTARPSTVDPSPPSSSSSSFIPALSPLDSPSSTRLDSSWSPALSLSLSVDLHLLNGSSPRHTRPDPIIVVPRTLDSRLRTHPNWNHLARQAKTARSNSLVRVPYPVHPIPIPVNLILSYPTPSYPIPPSARIWPAKPDLTSPVPSPRTRANLQGNPSPPSLPPPPDDLARRSRSHDAGSQKTLTEYRGS